jgi:hypothetical protein
MITYFVVGYVIVSAIAGLVLCSAMALSGRISRREEAAEDRRRHLRLVR